MVPWTLHIHGTFPLYKRFFRVEISLDFFLCSSHYMFFKELFTKKLFGIAVKTTL